MAHPLTEYRKQKNISLDIFAVKVGMSKASISRLESGKQKPSADLLIRIAEVTNNQVTPNDILFFEPAREVA
jgi:putative transcriptional regulator